MADTTVISTWTTGIQDVSAVAALLGTDQCEKHLDKMLSGGYLYGTSVFISMFGVLGASKWGMKLVLDTTRLEKIGFENSGEIMKSMWMKDGEMYNEYIKWVTSSVLGKYSYRNDMTITVGLNWIDEWCIATFLHSIIFSLLSAIPFIPSFVLNDIPEWMIFFPLLQIFSGTIIPTFGVIIEINNILKGLINKRINGSNTIEFDKKYFVTKINVLYLKPIIAVASITNVIAYVGCYTIIQNSQNNTPLIWFILEICLMLIRLIIWAIDPDYDKPPPIYFKSTGKVHSTLTEKWVAFNEPKNKLKTLRQILKDITQVYGFTENVTHDSTCIIYGELFDHGKTAYIIKDDNKQKHYENLFIDRETIGYKIKKEKTRKDKIIVRYLGPSRQIREITEMGISISEEYSRYDNMIETITKLLSNIKPISDGSIAKFFISTSWDRKIIKHKPENLDVSEVLIYYDEDRSLNEAFNIDETPNSIKILKWFTRGC